MRRILTNVIVLAGMCSIALAGDPPADFGVVVRKFSATRYRIAQELSSRLNLPLPPQADAFFRVAVTGQWESVSNHFEHVVEQGTFPRPIPQLQNELWAPVQETMGIWEVWTGWKEDSALLKMSYDPVLESMPKGSIYFGGTEYGRFVITTVSETMPTSAIYCITQNALSDPIYSAYLRAAYTNIWVPKQQDIDRAITQYIEEVETGARSRNDDTMIAKGRVSRWGVMGVMALHGIIARMIFEHNKASHSFFVEESYVLDWMYPYLEPHGLIMKLNRDPMGNLSEDIIARDREFWDRYVGMLESNQGFTNNVEARKTFARLRCAIAGLYANRKLFAEAETAFKQAIRLCPDSPEASYRLVDTYLMQGHPRKAIAAMRNYLRCAPPDQKDKAEAYTRQLEDRMQNNGTEPIW
jgi:hypothetical protein